MSMRPGLITAPEANRAVAVAVLLLLGGSVSPGWSSPPSKSSVKRLEGQVRLRSVSGPDAGVKLLESIFSRVMNIPQIAMAKPEPQGASQVELRDNQAVDYNLAIRPKEKGKASFAPQSPSLRVLPSPQTSTTALPPTRQSGFAGGDGQNEAHAVGFGDEGGQQLAWGNQTGVRGKASHGTVLGSQAAFRANASSKTPGLPATAMGKFVYQAGDNLYDSRRDIGAGAGGKQNVEAWKGSLMSRESPSEKVAPTLARAEADRLGIWEPQPEQSADLLFGQGTSTIPSGGPELSTRKAPDLPTAVSRFYNATRKIEEMQRAGEAESSVQAETKAKPAPVVVASDRRDKSGLYQAQRRVQIIDDRPSLTDLRTRTQGATFPSACLPSATSGAGGGTSNARLPQNAIPAQILSVEDSDSLRSRLKQQRRDDIGTGGTEGSYADSAAGSLLKKLDRSQHKEQIALLPPNVATGIPLVSLGTSQTQVASALSRMGQLREHRLSQWTVLTWQRNGAPSGTALQLFFRHGLLDAIRIFDPTLIAPDFGVSPGDSLEQMKRKFGEPAFLIGEPGMKGSQNYIYPISQVGFQLARKTPAHNPEVVSVLIFSVK